MSELILVPVDGSPLSWRALRHALERFPDGDIVVYYVSDVFEHGGVGDESTYEPFIGSDDWYAMEQQAADELLSEAEKRAAGHDREITTDSEIGDPQRLIPEYAREEDVDHIVMGVHGRDDEERSLVGRVAESVVFRAPVPVTVIR